MNVDLNRKLTLESLTDSADPMQAAEDVLDRLRVYGEARRLLFPLVFGWARNRARASARVVEDVAFGAGVLRPKRQVLPNAAEIKASVEWERANPALYNLLALQFSVSGDSTYTTWGSATVEDHRARASHLRRMAERTLQTAARHEEAAELLERHGAATLNDLFKTEAVAA